MEKKKEAIVINRACDFNNSLMKFQQFLIVNIMGAFQVGKKNSVIINCSFRLAIVKNFKMQIFLPNFTKLNFFPTSIFV